MKQYDVIVIGAGPGGLAAAYQLADSKKVLVVERDLWGGTCPNVGCDPKKMLYSAVQAKDQAGRMTRAGLEGIPDINWPNLMAFKRGYTDTVPSGTLAGLKNAGIDTVHGAARFLDPRTVAVAGETYRATNFVIATGQAPALPKIPGASLLKTSSDFLNLDQLPMTLAFIGAGYVALELANIAAAAGATVHLINHSARALRSFPEDAVAQLLAAMKDRRIIFHDNVALTGVISSPRGVILQAADFSLEVQTAFSAVGRVPAVTLGLGDAGVQVGARGIQVDDHLRTTNPHIFALGDVIAKTQPKLTPVASFEGRYVGATILADRGPIDYPAQPVVVYGTTELAQVGISLADAEAAPDRYTINTQDVSRWYTYNRLKDDSATVTVITDKASGEIAGAIVVSTIAEELINYLTLLMDTHVPGKVAAKLIYAYPTPASDLQYLV
ncbi:dihydrolipoyl dehydrogenase family protein [Lacticaseibacillus mingshuiensis]|uniref:Dihydrolipoyl dehydrogenase family protein n=1 Tax=Lacticaseibacillus mingshuiensis TaxID=2799574 RepID=A0ABW4CGW7_9LACO|nr:NAD(P)/FAD-dependent oxidoreductase [Lacticaseibacillus mingshuiensis]